MKNGENSKTPLTNIPRQVYNVGVEKSQQTHERRDKHGPLKTERADS
jgi:hypothetical protein